MSDDLDDESFKTTRSLATLVKAAATARSVLLQPPLNFSSVKRLIEVDEDTEEISANEDSDDALAEELVDAASELSFTERQGSSEISVDPSASLATLFDKDSPDAKVLKPRLYLAWDMSAAPTICGILTACEFSRDGSLGTSKFTQAYMDSHKIPRLSANNCLLVDVVSSSGDPRGVGALLLISAYMTVFRSRKYEYLAAVAVSAPGKSICERLGFHTHSFREGTQRQLCWILAGELSAADVNRRLRVDSKLPAVCWRHGFTARTSQKRFPRCG